MYFNPGVVSSKITRNNNPGVVSCKITRNKGLFTRSKFSIKNLVKVFFDKVLCSCKPASKTLSKNFDGLWRNRNRSYFSKNFEGLWWELTNQNIFPIKIYVNSCAWVWKMTSRRSKYVWSNVKNFEQTLTCKRDNFDKVFFEQSFHQKLTLIV